MASLPTDLLIQVAAMTPVEWMPSSGVLRCDEPPPTPVKEALASQLFRRMYDFSVAATEFAAHLDADEVLFKCLHPASAERLETVRQLAVRAGLGDWVEYEKGAMYNSTVLKLDRALDECDCDWLACSCEPRRGTLWNHTVLWRHAFSRHFERIEPQGNLHPSITEVDRAASLASGSTQYAHVTYFDHWVEAHEFDCFDVKHKASTWRDAWLRVPPENRKYWKGCRLQDVGAAKPWYHLRFRCDTPGSERWWRPDTKEYELSEFLCIFLMQHCNDVRYAPHNWEAYNPLFHVDDLETRWMAFATDEVRAASSRPPRKDDRLAARKLLERLVAKSGWRCCVCNKVEFDQVRQDTWTSCVCYVLKCSCWWDAVKAVVHAPENQALFKAPALHCEPFLVAERAARAQAAEVERRIMNEVNGGACAKRQKVEEEEAYDLAEEAYIEYIHGGLY